MQVTPERRRPSPARRAVLISCALAAAAATAPAQAALDFRTPDGTRFVLLPDQGAPTLTWAVATPVGPQVDPAGLPGLAAATVHASMRGTFRTGSLDANGERAALKQLDDALAAFAASAPGEAQDRAAMRVAAARTALARLSDPHAFRRVLAAAPTNDLEIRVDDDVAVLTLSTTPAAVPVVARLLLERREEPALRGVDRDLAAWQAAAIRHFDGSSTAPLYAEVLAMAFPGHPLARAGDRPNEAICRREAALSTWSRSQHPRRSVHVLVGNFDPDAVRAQVEAVFATTSLPVPDAVPAATPREQAATRRSMVPGARHPAALVAFALKPGTSPEAAATAARWLADGPDSWLARELAGAGRPAASVAVRAPWPAGAATGLFVLEVADQPGAPVRLADDVLAALARAKTAVPQVADLQAAFASTQCEFTAATDGRAATAAFVAGAAVRHPEAPLPQRPAPPAFAELPAQLRALLATHPVVVEWRDA